jgi:hypothetical protein
VPKGVSPKCFAVNEVASQGTAALCECKSSVGMTSVQDVGGHASMQISKIIHVVFKFFRG